jgi:hypothetical protein
MTKTGVGLLAAFGLLLLAGCADERPPMSGLRDQPAAAPGQPPNAPIRQPGNRP